MIYESYLAHHGVKGMKWGHRKEKVKQSVRRFGNSYVNAAHNVINNKGAARKQFKRNIVGGIGKTALVGIGVSAIASTGVYAFMTKAPIRTVKKTVKFGKKLINNSNFRVAMGTTVSALSIGLTVKSTYEGSKKINKAAETGTVFKEG